MEIAGQGTYSIDADTGVVTFVPVAGFVGTADPVRYLVTDATGKQQSGTVRFASVLGVQVNADPDAPYGAPVELAFTGDHGTGALTWMALVCIASGVGIVIRFRRKRRSV